MGYNDMFLEEVQFVTAQALQPFNSQDLIVNSPSSQNTFPCK